MPYSVGAFSYFLIELLADSCLTDFRTLLFQFQLQIFSRDSWGGSSRKWTEEWMCMLIWRYWIIFWSPLVAVVQILFGHSVHTYCMLWLWEWTVYLEVAILINCTIYCSPVLGRTSFRMLHLQVKHVQLINYSLRDINHGMFK